MAPDWLLSCGFRQIFYFPVNERNCFICSLRKTHQQVGSQIGQNSLFTFKKDNFVWEKVREIQRNQEKSDSIHSNDGIVLTSHFVAINLK